MRRQIVALALLSSLATAHAQDSKTWMSVMLDGRKVGKLVTERSVTGDTVTTRQTIDLRVTRGSTPLVTHNEAVATESLDGKPLAFHASKTGSSQENAVDGQPRPDGTFQVTTRVGDDAHVSLLAWTPGAVLSEGQRLAIVAGGFKAGSHYPLKTFDAMKQEVATLDVEVIGDEMIDLPGGTERLHHLRQRLAGGSGAQSLDMWVNDRGEVRRGISPLLGFRMEVAACDEACATAPDQDIDVLRSAMLQSPRIIPNGSQGQAMTYRFHLRDDLPAPFVNTDEQQVKKLSNGDYEITVGHPQRHDDEPGPTPEDTASNPWVQSDAPEVIALAKEAVGNASSDLNRMRRLRSFLTSYIDQTGLEVGYASALETIQTRRGDCTEHAVLLAAMARSQGIPTRIVTGLVYAQRFAGASRVFVPHTWVQAWINGRWESFDSAQSRFDATHIALGVGSGDPWRFFASMASLGRMQVADVKISGSMPDFMQGPAPSQQPATPSFNPVGPVGQTGGRR
ncbi:MAG: transglutaminase-like domain-containing protein [Luteibacter sp.]|uniref:transglutaminase-like domain-containing protein n=1 Tax=Luteibacter sp. TaxID=1886636 RepID=UPI00280777D6|nr:transglutaminase-like domain-containing protein [Luteibacter sp.]MDQ7997182.1 transglutaminase-like domain-containing protein [Luteibacter sp.]MDQ8049920.1 transglutaminase-like domain-containing protein [Luteibacter sp.]